MTRGTAALCLVLLIASASAEAQRRTTAARGRAAQAAAKTEPATFTCPSPLGEGVKTKLQFCDVNTGREYAEGILIMLPPRTGPVTLSFDLHNRHIYSEELIKTNRAYRHYTATIGVLTDNNDLLSRFVVQNEFRNASDVVDRIAGDVSPGGLKAVAPTGLESISVEISDPKVESVSILGEKLAVVRPDSPTPDNFTAAGRPIAIVSNVQLTYRPAPARRR
ncbi:MAG: hypothetical protein FJW14_09480 [Acidimicrobiia bacterium]|nr:hypothetical protein [Acidimicrobiia bacterium]